MSNKLKSHPLLAFYILAFALAWCIKIPVVLSNTNNAFLRLLPSFFPALTALLVTVISTDRHGIRELLAQAGRVRVSPAWYVIALVGPMTLNLLAVALAVPFGEAFPRFDFPGIRVVPVILVATFFALGEELGWRGFALPRLERRLNMLTASLVVGLLWWAWHLPEALAGPSAGLSLQQVADLELRDLFLDIGASILISWIYEGSGRSVFLVALFHVGIGLLGEFLAVSQADGVSLFNILFDILLWIAAGIMVLTQTLRLPTRKSQML